MDVVRVDDGGAAAPASVLHDVEPACGAWSAAGVAQAVGALASWWPDFFEAGADHLASVAELDFAETDHGGRIDPAYDRAPTLRGGRVLSCHLWERSIPGDERGPLAGALVSHISQGQLSSPVLQQ